MNVKISNTDYLLLKGYQENNRYRSAFNQLANDIFELSFEQWYQLGYWNDKYIPYTLFDNGKAVSNVSVNTIDFHTPEGFKHCIQIGTVMTDRQYRGKGLLRFLMAIVLKEWDSTSDFIYLYANDSVLNMYPKFDFAPANEYCYFKEIKMNCVGNTLEKLNMDSSKDRSFFFELASNTVEFSCLSMKNNVDLMMFYCAFSMKDNVYYLRELETAIVARINSEQIHLLDVFCKNSIHLNEVIDFLCSSNLGNTIKKIMLGFVPKDMHLYQRKENVTDDYLFTHKGKTKLFDNNNLMFPVLSHA